ncbi:MAG: hypothetical protein NC123_15595 [Butyrivibrio sp.]|nr:hypothetical protein [Acetatifactor muris]MCM1560943.1 hypothetical protein [Butyrivibrio sp.]
MYKRFGEFDSAAEINETAVNLRKEGDTESIRVLARENGIDEDIVDVFLEGDILYLCDAMSAAIGKIEVEAADMQAREIMADWAEYIKARCFEDEAMSHAVRSKEKSLKGCIGALLAWSFNHQIPVDEKIMKAAGVKASKCTLGIPGIGTAKQIITEYYLGEAGGRHEKESD